MIGIGKVVARALARCGFGDDLLRAYNNSHEESLEHYVKGWREKIDEELRTNARGFLQSAKPGLRMPHDFPDLNVLLLYMNPATSQSAGRGGGGPLKDNKPINLAKLAALCEKYFEWGTRSVIIRRFRSLSMWDAAIMTILRQAALEQDEKEVNSRRAAGNQDTLVRGVRRPPNHDSLGLDVTLVRKYLDKNMDDYLAQAFVNRGPQPVQTNRTPLIKILKKEKDHVSTDFMPEYKIEVDPEDFVQLTLSGIKGTRPESHVITGDETDEDEEDEVPPTQPRAKQKKSKKKQPEPFDPYTMKCPASILLNVDPNLVQSFEQGVNDKERKKEEGENAKIEKARERERKAREKVADKQERQRERERKQQEKEEKVVSAKSKGKGKQKRKSAPPEGDASSDESPEISLPPPQKKRKPNKKSAETTQSQDTQRGSSVTIRDTGLAPFPLSRSPSFEHPTTFSSPPRRASNPPPCDNQPGPSRSRHSRANVHEEVTYSEEDDDVDLRGGFLFSLPESDNPDHLERDDLNERFRKDLPTQARWSEVGPTAIVPGDTPDEDVDMLSRDEMLDRQFQASFMSQAHSISKKSQLTKSQPKPSNSAGSSAKPSNAISSSAEQAKKSRLVRLTPAPIKRSDWVPVVTTAPPPKTASSSSTSVAPSGSSISSTTRRHSAPLFTLEAAPLLRPTTPPFPDRITAADGQASPSLFLPSPSPMPERIQSLERHSSATSTQSAFPSDVIDIDSDDDSVSHRGQGSSSFGYHNAAKVQRAHANRARKSASRPLDEDEVIDLS